MCLLFFFSTMMLRLGFRGVRGVYGAAERRHAAPAVVGRLGLALDKEFGFWGHDDGRRRTKPGSPPNPPWFFEQKIAKFLPPIFFSKKNLAPNFFLVILMIITPRRRGKPQ